MTRFEESLALVLRWEGGFVDNPNDPGGATNMGVTRKTLARWRGISPWWKLPKAEVGALKSREVTTIYRKLFWDRCRANSLPTGLDYALFDFAVNSGPMRAIQDLQAIVGARPDGFIGPLTLKALKAKIAGFGIGEIIRLLSRKRLNFLKRLKNFSIFGRGWAKRVAHVQKQALADADTSNSPPLKRRKSLMNFLSGYKTYIIAVAMLVSGIGQMLGLDLPGFNDQSAGQLIVEALAVLFLRQGIKTEISSA